MYGADAIGGVTNFILKKNFRGVQLDMQQGFTEAGDGEEFRVSGVLGTDFGEGRGNITVAAEHYNRKSAYERNRSFYTDGWADPNQLTDDLFFYGSAGFNSATDRAPGTGNPNATPPIPDFYNTPNDATMRALLGTPAASGFRAGGPSNNSATHQYRFGPNGQVLSALFGDNTARWDNLGLIDGQRIARVNNYDNSNGVPANTNVIQTLKYNDPEALASAPQERFSFFTSANYDITDELNFSTRLNFSRSKTHTRLYPTVPVSGWEGRATFNPVTDSPVNPSLNWRDPAVIAAWRANPTDPTYANPGFIPTGTVCTVLTQCPVDGVGAEGLGSSLADHPVSPEVAIMLLSRPNPGGTWMVELFPDYSLGRRTSDNNNSYWQVETAFNYRLPFKDWTAELYGSTGEYESQNLSHGNLSLQRWRAMLMQRDWGRGSKQQANSPQLGATNVNFGTVPVPCTTGYYDTLFAGEVAPSQDCLDAVMASLQDTSSNRQDVLELNLQGGLFELPAGEVRSAFGYSYRDNFSTYTPDQLESSISYLDQVVGKYPVSYLDVSQHTQDVYAELLVPVVRDLPMLNKVELELGFRHSTYEFTDSTDTYKALANIEVNNALRVRGGFNRANRAPNLGEQFLELQQIFVGAVGGIFSDACSLRSNATFGAGGAAPDPVGSANSPNPPANPTEPNTALAPGQTAEGAQSTYLICQAQMGPDGAANFYSADQGTTQYVAAGFSNAWLQQVGNQDLQSEKADTWSAGFVFAASGVSDSPWLQGFSGSVDWWKVDIKDAIQPYSADYAGWLCYGQVTVATLADANAYISGPGKESCDKVVREPTRGGAIAKRVAFDNQATIATSGIDVAINWSAPLNEIGVGVPGRFGINTQATFLDYYRTKASPLNFDIDVDWKGSLGPSLTGTNPGAYKYRINTNFNYSVEKFNVNLGWRHLPSVWTAAKAYENAIVEHNAMVTADPTAGILLGYTKSAEIKTKSYSEFSLAMNYQVNDMLSVRAGIDNLFDVKPPAIGSTSEVLIGNTTPTSATAPGVPLTDPANRCYQLPGCSTGSAALPRSSFAASAGQFTGTKGYYDILGRSFFLGFKANF